MTNKFFAREKRIQSLIDVVAGNLIYVGSVICQPAEVRTQFLHWNLQIFVQKESL